MGKNKAQKAAEARQAASTPAETTTTTPEPATTEPIAESIQLAVDLCGPKPTAKAAKAVAKLQQKPAPAAPRATCTQTKKDGTPCTAKALLGKETCVDHQPAWDRLTHEEHVAFGEWLRQARGPEIVEVIGWWEAKQIAKDKMGPVPTEQEGKVE